MSRRLSLITMVDGIPTFNPELLMVDVFKQIKVRDKDRNKRLATKELAYIWFMADIGSEFRRNFTDEERADKVIKLLKFDGDWKPDKLVEEGIRVWQEMNPSDSLDLLDQAKSAVKNAKRLLSLIERKMQNAISEIENDESIIEANPEKVDKVFSDYNRLNKMVETFPTLIENIGKMEEKVKKEQDEARGKGGKSVNRLQLE